MHKGTLSSPFSIVVVAASVVVSSLAIHFWLADWFSRWLGLSRDAAEAALFLFQGLFTAWCALKVAKTTDKATNRNERRIKK